MQREVLGVPDSADLRRASRAETTAVAESAKRRRVPAETTIVSLKKQVSDTLRQLAVTLDIEPDNFVNIQVSSRRDYCTPRRYSILLSPTVALYLGRKPCKPCAAFYFSTELGVDTGEDAAVVGLASQQN